MLGEFKRAIAKNGMTHQLVPANYNRRNIAEKALQTFKHHFVSMLCGTEVHFPMTLWCCILRQAEYQLNMLRKPRVNPEVSSFEILYGPHNYDANPFAPLGSAVQMHVMPNNRKTWEAHTKAGYYLGNLWEHYRCHEIWIEDTKSVRIGQTVFFKHKYLTQPAVTDSDALHQGADDIVQALKENEAMKGGTRTAIDYLINIFKGVDETKKSEVNDHRSRMSDAALMRTASEDVEVEETG